MRLSARSYPHPVVGNRDDVPGAAFQATMEMTADKQFVYIAVDVACSCSALNSRLADGNAVLVAHVECSNTLFRKAFEFRESPHRISIPADNLNNAVEVNVFMRAVNRMHDYRLPEAHAEYGNARFDVRRGDILAVAEGQVFPVESSFDSLSKIGTIMQIRAASEEADLPMRVSYDDDKIMIILSKSDFADYKLLKMNEAIAGPLTTTIVLPVLLEALQVLETDGSGMEDDRRWIRALTRRIDNLGLGKELSYLVKAQKILELPVKRALSSARMLAEAGF